MEMTDKKEIISTLQSSPGALEAEDIEDFCSLAQYYASKTPQSFRRVSNTGDRIGNVKKSSILLCHDAYGCVCSCTIALSSYLSTAVYWGM